MVKNPLSDRAIEDNRLLKLIKEFYVASGVTYGSSWIHADLREAGEQCSVNRVAKIMRQHKLKAQIGYKRRHIKGGKHHALQIIYLHVNLTLLRLTKRG
jgi:putative transposase